MTNLEFDEDLIGQTQSFMADKRVKFIIDGYINFKILVNTGIPQNSLISPILFLIYISGVFEEVKKKIFQIINLFFINDLGFIIGGKINDIVIILQKISEIIIK